MYARRLAVSGDRVYVLAESAGFLRVPCDVMEYNTDDDGDNFGGTALKLAR